MNKIIFLLSVLAMIWSCGHDPCPEIAEVPAGVVNNKSEYKVGDTLHFVSKFSKYVPTLNSIGKVIGTGDMTATKWFPLVSVFRLDTTGYEVSTVGKNFSFVKDTAYEFYALNFSGGSSYLRGQYNLSKDTFDLEFKMVCKKAGVYFLNWISETNTGHGGSSDFPGVCTASKVYFYYNMNRRVGNNKELLKTVSEAYSQQWLQNTDYASIFDEAGGYCFKVVK